MYSNEYISQYIVTNKTIKKKYAILKDETKKFDFYIVRFSKGYFYSSVYNLLFFYKMSVNNYMYYNCKS